MTITLFAGSSVTAGDGFDLKSNEPSLWVNLLHTNNTHLQDTKLLNVSRGGRSNSGIFQDAVHSILHHNIKYAFVEWTSVPRYNMSLGLELYETRVSFRPGAQHPTHNLNDVTYTGEYLSSVANRFTILAHDHYEICDLVSYTNSLIKLAKLKNTQIFFINGWCPWDNNYFTELVNVLPDAYTNYTKKLLNIENRDDDEIFKLYKKIHTEYAELGTIQESYWINLYSSMNDLKEDTNQDNMHPGIKSNQLYYQLFNQAVNTQLQA